MKFHHYGVPVKEKLKNEIYIEHLKLYLSDSGKNEYGIEKMRFDEEVPYPEMVKNIPHLAFEVEDIKQSLIGKKIIIEPNSPSKGVIVAFIEEEGIPIELMQVDRTIAEEGI